jgi:hypothetical protein
MNRMDNWIESRLMNAKIKNAPATVTSWALPRKKYFVLRVSVATQCVIEQTFHALLSGIRSSDMIRHNPSAKSISFCAIIDKSR